MLKLTYISNPCTEKEKLEDIISLTYEKSETYNVQTVPHTNVTLPNGENIEVVSEFTEGGNRFTVRQEKHRLCFVQSPGNYHLLFRTLGGLEVMVDAEKEAEANLAE